ncbi:MAG: 16S rRNA (adenine(1518)-N(6)/adenine(1519)-N(6))-dimethyltransferase RsmA [Gulosibacter sp.]|uniref:16S rRNA (adenine(1518)-N(6)/adenine(1519)-N(6))- dimethyltransferase RsmA n=1 Tax=Gulosibacter sp. TaxID=2817531 RepID=UPI003F937E4A
MAEVRLLGPNEIRALAAQLDVQPTKKLGQNFVHDHGTVRRIVATAKVQPGEHILEVGPGLGSLTLALLEADALVTAIEIDERLARQLPTTAAEFAGSAAPNLHVIRQDAMRVSRGEIARVAADHAESDHAQSDHAAADHAAADDTATDHAAPSPVALVANLPYNISVPVLLHLLAELPTLQRGVVMVQNEVGERLAAGPGSKVYGSPSVKAAWYGTWRTSGLVGRKVFWPVPNVDSVLVSFEAHETLPGDTAMRDRLFKIVDAAFGQRRKMLRQALSSVYGSAVEATQALERAEVDPTARGESLGVEEFIRLAR